MAGEHVCVEHFQRWLRKGMSGCTFAGTATSAARINYVVQLDELTGDAVAGLDGVIDASGADGNFALILFPRLRTPRGIGRLLQVLVGADRWGAARVPWRRHAREGAALVALHFRTVHKEQSSVMGFAPLGCMPVTRRAPFVALAVWGGAKLNDHKASPAGEIGFIDASTLDADGAQVTADAHEKLWKETKSNVGRLLGDPPEDGWRLKDAAFCLPESVVAEFIGPAAA